MIVALSALFPTIAEAQSEFDVGGSWEGFLSNGDFLVVTNTAAVYALAGTYDAVAVMYDGGLSGLPDTQRYTFTLNEVSPAHWQLHLDDGMGVIDAYWYTNDAVRLHLPDGSVGVLARFEPGSSAVPSPTTSPLSEEAQAHLLSLVGTWEMYGVSPHDIPSGRVPTFEFLAVDLQRGEISVRINGTGSDEERERLRVISSTSGTLRVTPVDDDDQATIKFIGEDELELVIDNDEIIQMRRITP
jgi:hypothetical protein